MPIGVRPGDLRLDRPAAAWRDREARPPRRTAARPAAGVRRGGGCDAVLRRRSADTRHHRDPDGAHPATARRRADAGGSGGTLTSRAVRRADGARTDAVTAPSMASCARTAIRTAHATELREAVLVLETN